jgi:hypothetical protein
LLKEGHVATQSCYFTSPQSSHKESMAGWKKGRHIWLEWVPVDWWAGGKMPCQCAAWGAGVGQISAGSRGWTAEPNIHHFCDTTRH